MNCNKPEALKKDWAVLFIFLAAFSIRFLYIFQILKFPLTEYLVSSKVFDQHEFNQNALNIMSGNLPGKEVFGKEPLYSYFLAIIDTIFGYSHIAAYIIQALLTSIGAILVYKISKDIFNRKTGVIAGFIFSFYSMSIYYDAILLRESLITFFNILLLYLILKGLKGNKIIAWLLAGCALGCSTLLRHNILLPFILVFILCAEKPFKKASKHALVFCIGMLIALSPALVRNYIASDYKYIGISKEVNAFWVGNNPVSSGVDLDWSDEYRRLNDKSGGSIRKTAGVFFEELGKNPRVYAKLYIRKIWMFFNAYEAPSNTNYYLYREEFPTVLRWPLFNFRFACGLGIIGIFLAFLKKEKPFLLLIFLAVLSGSVILFHIQARFRLPCTPFFIMFAGYALYQMFRSIVDKHFLKCAVILTLAAFFYIALKPDLTYGGFRDLKDKIRPMDRTNLALSYIAAYERQKDNNFLKLALRQSDMALKEERDFYVPYLIKGRIYFLKGRLIDSMNEYKKAIVYNNHNPFLYNELAGVYYIRGAYWKSFLCIKRALHLSPGNKGFERNLSLIHL